MHQPGIELSLKIKILMHQPGIEPGSVPWQGTILPLDHWCWYDFKVFQCNALFALGMEKVITFMKKSKQ